MTFDRYIGIDYSGRETPTSRIQALQVYSASGNEEPQAILPSNGHKNWCRKEIAEWLIENIEKGRGKTFIAGIDHGFSFPRAYFCRYKLKTWEAFLDDFCQHWPTDDDKTSVNSIRKNFYDRKGYADKFRLTEKWTSSAKSVFQFDVPGSVAFSTHAGIPWLHTIKKKVGKQVYFWPFDGWQVPEGRSVIVEIYPSLLRKRYLKDKKHTQDQHDAYATARWLAEMGENGFLSRYFDPPLTVEQRQVAKLEGWIFGVS